MVSANSDNTHQVDHRPQMVIDQTSGSALTLAHLSDPHISCMQDITGRDLFSKRLFGYLRWKLLRGTKHGSSLLSALQSDIGKTKPDHIAVTGDLTHLSLSAEYKKTRQWLQSLGSPLQVTVIPGNHDQYVNTTWAETMAYWTDYMISDTPRDGGGNMENLDGIFPSLRIREHMAIIGVNTARPSAVPLAVGSIGALQLQNLEKVLVQTARQNYFRVLLIHHSPVPGAVGWRKRLTDAADLQSLLTRCGAELILHGHTHRAQRNYLKTSDGNIPVMGAPSISALDRTPERRARYYIYHLSPNAKKWIVSQEVRIYSPDQNRFIRERTQQLNNSQ